MDEASAKDVIRTSIRVMALLNQLVGDLPKTLPKAAFDAERLRIGSVTGGAVDLINAAVHLHSSLEVESDGAWEKAGSLHDTHWLKPLHHS